MSNQKIPMTKQGAESLREELIRLRSTDRPKIIQDIAEARQHGDLSENAEYHAARERQAFIEGRISDIERKLASAQIIDLSELPPSDKVVFGCKVTVVNVEDDREVTYQIVGEDEANLKLGKISVGSPISRALIGKSVGDTVEVKVPGGIVNYDIVQVDYH